jgi:nucleotide-binding universal stress UspA family protein
MVHHIPQPQPKVYRSGHGQRKQWCACSQLLRISYLQPLSWYDAGGSLEEANRHITKQAEEITNKIGDAVRASGLTVETAVRRGDPRSVILDEAKEWDADLIVVGSHGYTGIKRLLLGSVAQSVVSHAPCSVEVVRQKAENKQPGP